jgi:hypothetical protein
MLALGANLRAGAMEYWRRYGPNRAKGSQPPLAIQTLPAPLCAQIASAARLEHAARSVCATIDVSAKNIAQIRGVASNSRNDRFSLTVQPHSTGSLAGQFVAGSQAVLPNTENGPGAICVSKLIAQGVES